MPTDAKVAGLRNADSCKQIPKLREENLKIPHDFIENELFVCQNWNKFQILCWTCMCKILIEDVSFISY